LKHRPVTELLDDDVRLLRDQGLNLADLAAVIAAGCGSG